MQAIYNILSAVAARWSCTHRNQNVVCQQEICSDVKSSRPKWPKGQNFGLGL